MKKHRGKFCPKCRVKFEEKSFVYTGFPGNYEKRDVTEKTDKEIWLCAASGVVPKPKGKPINDCLEGTSGIGYLEKKLICRKCGFEVVGKQLS